jgi:hypothetical protein
VIDITPVLEGCKLVIVKNVLLVLGGALIVATGVYTLQHLTDRVVFTVLIPGIVVGLILIGIAMRFGRDRWRGFGQ